MIYILYNSAANLGNYLFQIGYALSVGGNSAIAFYVPDDAAVCRVMRYRALYPFVTCVNEIPGDIITIREDEIDLSKFCIDGKKDYLIDGYFQYPELLCRNKILEKMRCPVDVMDRIIAKYGDLFEKYETVGISVRRGDYLRLPHRHPFVGERYLKNSVNRFCDKSVFIVCSDDIVWCKKFFCAKTFPDRKFVFVEGESVLTQLFVHTLCQHNILSNSTFSWWGAYLNSSKQHITIVPSMWYGIGFVGTRFNLVLDGWIVEKSTYPVLRFVYAVFCILKTSCGNFLRKIGLYR